MPADVETITRTEFEHYRSSLVSKVYGDKVFSALFGLATIIGPIVTGVSVALAEDSHESKSFLYAGAALTVIAGYETLKHGWKYRTMQNELTTLDSNYHST